MLGVNYSQVKKVIEVQVLHMSVAHIPAGVSGTKAVYVIKLNSEPVPHCDSPAAARAQLPAHLEWGVLNGHSLQLLERVISLLYLPLLAIGAEPTDGAADADPALSEEFLVGLRKFASHVRRTIQQVEGDVKLRLPVLSPGVLDLVDKCVADVEIMKQVRSCVAQLPGLVCVYFCLCGHVIASVTFLMLPSLRRHWSRGPAPLLLLSSRCCARCHPGPGRWLKSSAGSSGARR